MKKETHLEKKTAFISPGLQVMTEHFEKLLEKSPGFKLMMKLSFDELTEAMEHASRQNEKSSRLWMERFRKKHADCFAKYDEETLRAARNEVAHCFIAVSKKNPQTPDETINCFLDILEDKNDSVKSYGKCLLSDYKSKYPDTILENTSDRINRLDNKKPKETIEVCERQIDFERLRLQFNRRFTEEKYTLLANWIKGERSPKDFAVCANIIYHSKYIARGDYRTFMSWYRTFCDIVGCECRESYKPSKLKPTIEQISSLYFLD